MNHRLLSRVVFLTLLISISFIPSYSQTNYSDYQASDLEEVYREDFDAPDSEWEVYKSGARMGKIHDGNLDWISMSDNAQMISHRLTDMDWGRDWQIEVRMKHLTGKPNSSNDLVWDIQDNNSKYHFGFTAQGKYVLSEKVPSEYKTIVPFTSSTLVKKDGFNTVTVRKVGTNYHFFFNERLITTKSGLSVTSNKVGFMVPPNSTLQVDYLDVSYLKAKSGYSSTGDQNYYAVMTKLSGLTTQRWKTRDNFPKDAIKSDWDAGYNISDLSYDNDKWSLIMSKGTGYSQQTWFTRSEWPKPEIKEKWDEGYHITELNYGNGVWAFVFSKNSGYTRQRWATSASFPSAKIKEFGEDNLWISEIAYGNDRWAVVGSKHSDIKEQNWYKTASFPESQLTSNRRNGFSITQLSYENGWWILLMSKYSTSRPQEIITSTIFPKDEIREYWDQGYHITDITHGGKVENTSFSNNTPTVNRANERIADLIAGRWYGGVPGEESKDYMIFEKDQKYISMITNGETIGGKDYEVDGNILDLKYEIDNTQSPATIDFIFYYQGSPMGRLKGLINMIDSDSFQILIAEDLEEPRPTSLSDPNNKAALFKRVDK